MYYHMRTHSIYTVCEDFRLTIRIKKTNIISQDAENLPTITMDNYQRDVVKELT